MHATGSRLLSLAAGVLLAGACYGDEPSDGVAEDVADVAATPAAASYGYETWDDDRDRRLTESEFADVTRDRAFSRWNTTADGGLDANELGTGLFGVWDGDNNDQVSETEWTSGTERWSRPGLTYGSFGDWDRNDDGWLDQTETSSGLERANFLGAWDADRNNLVDDGEFGRGVFDGWDANDDQAVDANEWDLGAGGVDWF